MAATLTADQELAYYSFPIDKSKTEETAEINPADGTPDLVVWGKASDGSLDGDLQVVDPEFSATAIRDWFDTGANVRVQHQAQRDPAGKGIHIDVTPDGTWVKTRVSEPVAKHLVRTGALNDYSIGISRPAILRRHPVLDPEGKAVNGIITGRKDGLTRISEISLVDRGSNYNTKFAVVKAAADGSPVYVGKVTGPGNIAITTAYDDDQDGTVTVDIPKTATVTFSPSDLAKLLAHREEAERRQADAATVKRDFDRNVGGGTDRDKLKASDFVFPETRDFPVVTPGDVSDAVSSWGRYKGKRSFDDFKRLLTRLARRKGAEFATELPEAWKSRKEKKADKTATAPAVQAGETSNPAAGHTAVTIKTGTAAQQGDDDDKDDVLHHQDGQDDDPDTEADDMDKTAVPDAVKPPKPGKATCPSCSARCKPSCRFCPQCGASMTAEKASKPVPDQAAGEEGRIDPAPPHREPDGPAMESLEQDAHIEDGDEAAEYRAAAARKAAGIPYDAAWMHDLLCPAYDPATARKCHPHAGLPLIDEAAWQAKALEVAASAPLEQAREAALLWQHARTVRALPADLAGEIAGEAHKAFRDANPGPGRAPVPGEIPAARYARPYLTAGHAAPSPGHDSPHTAPVQPGHISAADFQRGNIQEGHAAGSPGNPAQRPAPVPAPEIPGVPTRVYYTNVQRDNARQAMTAMHDHIARTFPDVCPMAAPGQMGEPGEGARPVPAGAGGPVPHDTAAKHDGEPHSTAAADRVTRLERRLRKARKAAGYDVTAANIPGEAVTLKAAAGPDLVKAVSDAVADLHAELASTRERITQQGDLIAGQAKILKKQAKAIDVIASQPDPAVTAYRGVALAGSPKASAAPAGQPTMAQRAEHAKAAVFNEMYERWRSAAGPDDRENAYAAMTELAGLNFGNPMST